MKNLDVLIYLFSIMVYILLLLSQTTDNSKSNFSGSLDFEIDSFLVIVHIIHVYSIL